MVQRVSGCFLAVVVAVWLAATPALSQQAAAGSATSGTLFAITGPTRSVLSRVDPVTGIITPIEDLAGPDHGQLGPITGDPQSHRIFALRTSFTTDPGGNELLNNEILTINDQTGAFSVSPPIHQPVDEIAFDMSAGALYELGGNAVFTVDPITAVATRIASLGTVSLDIPSMSVVPGAHTIYVNNEVLGPGTVTDQILTVDIQTGGVSASHELTQPVRDSIYDASIGGLFGATECCPRQLLRIDPAAGSEASLGTFDNNNNAFLEFAMALDPASHTVFMDVVSIINLFTTQDHIVSVDDQTGVTTVSPATNDGVSSLYFEPVVLITPESINANIRAALASGAITNAGVAKSLLAKLDAASASRFRGGCSTAVNVYRAFIHEVDAQSDKSIAASTASQLVNEAQFLISSCP